MYIVIFKGVKSVRKAKNVKPFLHEFLEWMKVRMEFVQHELFQVIRIQEEFLFVRLHHGLWRVKKTEDYSTNRGALLVFIVLFVELLPADPAWSLASHADMDEHPEKGFEVMNCIVEDARIRMTGEVSLTFQNFATGVWGSPLRLY